MTSTASRSALVAAFLASAIGCGDPEPIMAPDEPRAFIRFVHAMPDTLGVDFHAVDIVENSPYIATLFREIKQAGYTPVAPGTRHFREFLSNPSAPLPGTVSQVLFDTTMTLQVGAHYTMTHVGFARAGQAPAAKFVVFEDMIPTPPAGQIAVRIINLATGMGSVDVYTSAANTGALPVAPTFANVAYLAATGYANLTTTDSLWFRATVAGTGSAATVVATGTAPVGDVGTPSLDPIPGSAIAGSVMTVYLFPRSSPGTRAPQGAAFQVPVMIVVPDVQLHTRPGT